MFWFKKRSWRRCCRASGDVVVEEEEEEEEEEKPSSPKRVVSVIKYNEQLSWCCFVFFCGVFFTSDELSSSSYLVQII